MKTSYSSPRLKFIKEKIEPVNWEDVIRIYSSNDNCTYQMTKKEFYDVFDNVVKSDSYQKHRYYHYAKTSS